MRCTRALDKRIVLVSVIVITDLNSVYSTEYNNILSVKLMCLSQEFQWQKCSAIPTTRA